MLDLSDSKDGHLARGVQSQTTDSSIRERNLRLGNSFAFVGFPLNQQVLDGFHVSISITMLGQQLIATATQSVTQCESREDDSFDVRDTHLSSASSHAYLRRWISCRSCCACTSIVDEFAATRSSAETDRRSESHFPVISFSLASNCDTWSKRALTFSRLAFVSC